MLRCFCGRGRRSTADDVEADQNAADILKVKVIRGVNLAIRDLGRRSSDPYVILTLGSQSVKTRVVRQDCNPQWHEQLSLLLSKSDSTFHLEVYDHDTFSSDDPMGAADVDLKPYMESYENLKRNFRNLLLQEGTLISTVMPSDQNCLAGESLIVWKQGRLVQEMRLRLKNVECGEIVIEVELVGVAWCTCYTMNL